MFGTSPIELLAADAMLRNAIFCNSWVYNFDWTSGTTLALGANATVDNPINITSEADFVCQMLTLTTWGSAAGTLLQDPDYTLNIAISSGRPWFNSATLVRNICGSFAGAELPTSLPMPRLMPAQSTVTATLANRTGTAANRVQLSMIGFNVYYKTESRDQVFHAL